jgi:hypothetical protein
MEFLQQLADPKLLILHLIKLMKKFYYTKLEYALKQH